MAVTICRECKKEISSKADSCPICGYKKSSAGWWIGFLLLVILAISFIIGGCGATNEQKRNDAAWRSQINERLNTADSSRTNEQKLNAAESKVAMPKYTIVKIEDVSFSNCKRYSIRVRVDHVLSSDELKTLSNKIITDFKATRGFNALTLWFYLPDSNIDSAYTAGMTEYAPFGDWSRADDIETGEYTHHRLELSPGNATGLDPEKSRVPGLSIETKKRIFFELVAAQDRGVGDNEAYGIIAKKFSVGETTVRKIVIEGVGNGWPIP